MKERWYLLIPLLVLVWLLFSGRTPMFAGTIGLSLTAIVILGSAIILKVSSFGLRIAFWIALGLLCAGFFQLGIGVIFGVIAALVVVCWFIKGGRDTLVICLHALVEGARHAVPVGIACAPVGVIIGVVSLTGVASTFAGYIGRRREQPVPFAAADHADLLGAGHGHPDNPELHHHQLHRRARAAGPGVPLIVSHMFVFYFGIMADLTRRWRWPASPPRQSPGEGLKISMWAIRIAIAGFIVPFMAVYNPALMMQGGDWGATLYMLFRRPSPSACGAPCSPVTCNGPWRCGRRSSPSPQPPRWCWRCRSAMKSASAWRAVPYPALLARRAEPAAA